MFQTNKEYRKYMTSNAESIIQQNHDFAYNNNKMSHFSPSNTNLRVHDQHIGPYFFKSPLDQTQPYGYQTNETKEQFLQTYRNEVNLVSSFVSQ